MVKAITHATFTHHGREYEDGTVLIENGRILDVLETSTDNWPEVIDLTGKTLLPSWVDSHLHIPGDLLFRKFGVLLTECANTQEYLNQIERFKDKDSWIRGFGWSALVFRKGRFLWILRRIKS